MSAIVDSLTNIGDLLITFFNSVKNIGVLLAGAGNFVSNFFSILPPSMNLCVVTTILVAIFYKIVGRDS